MQEQLCKLNARAAYMHKDSREQGLLSNKFGVISEKQVIFLSKKGLLSSGQAEEIPLNKIYSVRFYKQKSWKIGIAACFGILLPFCINAFFSDSLIIKLIGLTIFVFSLWIAYVGITGVPTVSITTEEGKVTTASGWPNERSEAKAFALVLHEQIK